MSRLQPRISTLAPSPHPKPALSIEEWDAKAPLKEHQIRSTNDLRKACETRPLPPKYSDEAEHISRPGTPVKHLTPISRPGTPSKSLHPLHPTHPITTPQQFHDWFAVIDRSISHSQESHFRAHLASVSSHLSTCDTLAERLQQVNADVLGMTDDWRGVEEGGQSLQGACEKMLEERDRLIQVTDGLDARLEYFQELEHATRILNHPGDSLVLQDDFLIMVERVDVCIEFLQNHRDYREAQVYLMRFQQCMTRAMTLIKMHFVSALKALSADIQKRMYDKDVSSTAQMHLLYSKFQSAATQLAPLLSELERRAAAHPDELAALLNECHGAYFNTRKSLVANRLVGEIRGLDPGRSELVELTRAGCSYLKQLCTDEFTLFRKFFDSGEDQLYRYLESLCDYLYDDLRPRILHEPKLTILCQVCTVLQALMVLDVSGDFSDDDESEGSGSRSEADSETQSESNEGDASVRDLPVVTPTMRDLKSANIVPPPTPRHQLKRRLHIGSLLEMVLQDAQTRLFFRAQAFVQAEIKYYVPTGDDLDYPKKLTAFKNSSKDGLEDGLPGEGTLFAIPSWSKQPTWYPTVAKTHWVLSQLQDYVKPAILEDMAHEAISLCRESLASASDLLAGKTTPSDAQLFLIRHLLILKEITVALGLEMVQSRGVDFSGVTNTLGSLLYNPNAILGGGLAGLRMPRVVDNIADARTELDVALKKTCEDAIAQCVDTAIAPLYTFTSVPGSSDAQSAHTAFLSLCDSEVKAWVTRLRVYLEDDQTVAILLPPMQTKIIDSYELFKSAARERAKGDANLEVKGTLSSAELMGMLKRLCAG